LLNLFVSLTPKVFALPTCPLSFCNWIQSFQGFNKERQLLGLSQFFEVNDMQNDFSRRSPRVSGAVKVNNNRILVEENLAFIGCGVVGAAVVDDVEVGELLS
jgi:hypothetical protein